MLTYSAPDPFEPGDEEAWKELCLPLLWMLSDKELQRIPVIWQHSLHVCNNGRIPAA